MKLLSPRMRFVAALVLYFGWVAVLTVMAATSSTRPTAHGAAPAATAP